jgi:hypothetical protein
MTYLCCVAKTVVDHRASKSGNIDQFKRLSFALSSTITAFSDQQILTGISLLVAGITQIPYGFPIYYWERLVNLAWLSAITHVVTLTSLRTSHSWGLFNLRVRIMRAVLMGILIVMIAAAMWPVGYMMTLDKGSSLPKNFPVWCLYNPSVSPEKPEFPEYNLLWFLANLSVLILGYLTRIHLLFFENFSIWHSLLRVPKDQPKMFIELWLSKFRGSPSKDFRNPFYRCISVVFYKCAQAVYALVIIGKNVGSSMVWEVCNVVLEADMTETSLTLILVYMAVFNPVFRCCSSLQSTHLCCRREHMELWTGCFSWHVAFAFCELLRYVKSVALIAKGLSDWLDALNALPMDSKVNFKAAASCSRQRLQTSTHSALPQSIAPVTIAQEIRRLSWFNAAWILMYLQCFILSFLAMFRLLSELWVDPYFTNLSMVPLIEILLSATLVLYLFILLFAPSMQWAVDKLTRSIKFQSLKRGMEWFLWTLLITPCLWLSLGPLGPTNLFRYILPAIFSTANM